MTGDKLVTKDLNLLVSKPFDDIISYLIKRLQRYSFPFMSKTVCVCCDIAGMHKLS